MRVLPLLSAAALGTAMTAGLTAQSHTHDHTSPYAGYQDRAIKALSQEEVEGLLRGDGMTMALPAELNGYPGPRHVLEMAGVLELQEAQRVKVQEIVEDMRSRARQLGREIVELERTLDQGFAARTMTEARLVELLRAVEDRRADLRAAHLRAHLLLAPLLTDQQRTTYMRRRGYGG